MPYTQTTAALGGLSSATSGSWIALPQDRVPVVVVAATSVTSGAVIAIEGRQTKVRAGVVTNSPARELHRVTVAADGNTIIPLEAVTENEVEPTHIRLTVVSRTDGTYTGTLYTHA